MRLETLVFPVLLSTAAGCAALRSPEIFIPNRPHAVTADRITRFMNKQRAHVPYGNHFRQVNTHEYHDGFEQEGHIFATTISENDGKVVVHFYADNIVVTDILGDGQIDAAYVFDGNYDYELEHTHNQWRRKVDVIDPDLRLFEDAFLYFIEQKYTTGTVSPGSITDFLKAKNGILYRS